ncbi:uncharacterized protein LOC127526058 [Erpetoichthys calabaricus]|uniref:uncharacterized protein LOC127526058 n=1 Tax=Erpetoichthys calabaricus TaxID=27687 RepID=UPI00223450FB|nr:uncharacterized protein LOC127526058 [Erpetoichthys calabaricus]
MSAEREQLQGVLTRAMSCVREAEEAAEADDFAASCVRQTRALFRRSARRPPLSGDTTTRKKGRSKCDIWKLNFFLLQKHNEEYVPPPSELSRLTRNGLGPPKHEQPGTQDRYGSKSSINRNWTIPQLEKFIIESYPNVPLHLTGFSFAKAEKGRRLHSLQTETAAQLQKKIGKGKIFIIPHRDIPLPIQMEQIHTAQEESEFRPEIPGQVHAETSYQGAQATLSQEPHVDRLENTREPQAEVDSQLKCRHTCLILIVVVEPYSLSEKQWIKIENSE